jgi:choline dehydrogenase-like flavoprotein
MPEARRDGYDVVVIGSGFGGAMVAHELVRAGRRVLLVERGGWVERGAHLWDEVGGFFQHTAAYTTETAYRVSQRAVRRGAERWDREGICACVGGPSLFYGGASFRFREADFEPTPEIAGDSGAEWPFGYAELEPYYSRAERLLGIAGEAGVDPTEPPRSAPYPVAPAPLSPLSRRVADAARGLGLHPFPIPLALNRDPEAGALCQACTTCDAYACAIGAKNDLATRVLSPLLGRGLDLRPDTVAVRLRERGGRVVAVECVDRRSGEPLRFEGERFVLSAGALASPHLLLASGLERLNPGGAVVGRYLMRHCNAFVYGIFPAPPNRERVHHKQVAIHDYYFGDPGGRAPKGKLGNLQQIMAPQTGAVLRWAAGRERLSRALAPAVRAITRHMTGLQVIAEDQPRPENRLVLDPSERDRFGLPTPRVHHRYTERDLAARAALVRRAGEVLRAAGARLLFPYHVTTFSHVVGTVRTGRDPARSALDEDCRFRGVENLHVVDGSFMPTSAAVNPSLTIAANALRVGERINVES